ncbi:hypothetical protein [Xenorhabdus griffiniae]|uniref:Phage protein n=1 Tax=Xenorhabdus griffiniae TaxID=351672 RepID=A0ABY9XM36_9GAMM|nr:hypothetical protein [Xenorhabdus griffiniae]MBD1229260.1 hypothetical protein [Xenorhabdus griffiniae]MBE8589007.1 hypothetical protein [Xenorhabdus griffiniae]WMV73999.1 hypothetical protein QL128_08395 [Xenorhabdus griffiniae]WNH03679.1 hypothetical protein QL112_008400 [Xenorhabdus griffiniae]
MTNSDLCRAAFEKLLLTKFRYFENALEKDGDGTYFNMSAQNYWEVFQAGWKASLEMIAHNETINDIWEMLERQGFKIKGPEMNNDVIELAKKLAEYENMKPLAYYNLVDGKICKSIDDFDKDKTMFAVCLYPHPNK